MLVKPKCVSEIFANARARGERKLTESEALAVVEAYGIPVARSNLAHSASEAGEIAAEVGWPVAMKIVSPQVVHKSDVGGVRLSIESEREAGVAYADIVLSVHQAMPDAEISGVLVQRQVEKGRELICGITRQKGFGPLVMVGLGGVLVEVLRDTSFRLAPIDELDASEMLDELRGSAILDEFRGQAAADRGAIEDVLVRLARLGTDFSEIEEMDINPLVASASGVVAVDARILLSDCDAAAGTIEGDSDD